MLPKAFACAGLSCLAVWGERHENKGASGGLDRLKMILEKYLEGTWKAHGRHMEGAWKAT